MAQSQNATDATELTAKGKKLPFNPLKIMAGDFSDYATDGNTDATGLSAGAGSDGGSRGSDGMSNPSVKNGSEQSSQPMTADNPNNPAPNLGTLAGISRPDAAPVSGSTADLENRITPAGQGMPVAKSSFADTIRSKAPGILGGIGAALMGMGGTPDQREAAFRLPLETRKQKLAERAQGFTEEQGRAQIGLEKQRVGLQGQSVGIEQQRANTENSRLEAEKAWKDRDYDLANKQFEQSKKQLDEEIRFHKQSGTLEHERNTIEARHNDILDKQIKMQQDQFTQTMQMSGAQFAIGDVDKAADAMKDEIIRTQQNTSMWQTKEHANEVAGLKLAEVEQWRTKTRQQIASHIPAAGKLGILSGVGADRPPMPNLTNMGDTETKNFKFTDGKTLSLPKSHWASALAAGAVEQ